MARTFMAEMTAWGFPPPPQKASQPLSWSSSPWREARRMEAPGGVGMEKPTWELKKLDSAPSLRNLIGLEAMGGE